MNWTVLASALGLLMVPAALARFDRLFLARTAIRINRTAVAGGLVLLFSGLAVTAGPVLLRSLGLTRFAMLCERMFEHVVAAGPVVGTLSGMAASWVLGAAMIGINRARRLQKNVRVDPEIGARFEWHGVSVVVLDTADHGAYAVPGRHPQVVVTLGLWRRLTRQQKRVLIAHEMAHVTGRHACDLWMIGAVQTALGWIPAVARGAGFWREALERSADDDAASLTGPRIVRDAIRDLALLQPSAALGFGGVGSTLRRLEYIGRDCNPPSQFAAGAWVWVLAMIGSAATSILIWMSHTHSAVSGLIYCPV